MDDFLNVISFENLYKAHRRARLSKRHKREVIEFEANLSENLWKLHYDLLYGKYKVGGYHNFMIYDPKEREIQAIGYVDRVIQHSICDNYLTPLLNKILIYDNVACRKNKGTSFAIKRWRNFMANHYKKQGDSGYFVKIDVKKYFPSINHDVLKDILKDVIKDAKILGLLFNIIDSYNFNENVGLPMGNQTSQCFALLYLDKVDKFIKQNLKVKYYVRYMDDMLFLVESKSKAKQCISETEKLLNALQLKMNYKSQISTAKNGITFLGWRFYYGKNGKIIQKVKRQTKKRIVDRVKITVYKFGKNKTKLNAVKVSYIGYMQKGNAYNFTQKLSTLFVG